MKMESEKPKQKKEQQRITQIALIKTKKITLFYKKTVTNSFVKFVQFVVKKWVGRGKTNKSSVLSVVKYFGVALCGLCGFYSFCFLNFNILFAYGLG
jgi:hypothetical protein